MVNRPGFFKFYVPWLGEESQKIAPRFIQSLPGNWPMNLSLRDRYNNLWNVKVEMIGEGAGGRITKNSEEQQIMKIESNDDIVNHTDKPDYVPIDDNDDYDSMSEEENPRDDNVQVEQVTDVKEANHQDAHTVEKELMNVSKCEQITRKKGPRDDAPLELVRDGTASSSKCKIKRTTRDWYGVELFKTGFIPPPQNPYFVTKKRRNRAYELYIPMDVIKSYNLKLPENVTLLDPKGRQFPAKRKIWTDRRMFYIGGWKGLCRVNMVEDRDSCICEFLYNADDICISVSFFPPK
ncbi:B3 domain-containing protein REM21-like [Salvia divinorum]|uniref:B3 domain-containing protein REM21-like n=1 Tax=Salvia divinorum TaxID=28513 RepID=A0ABD1I240_SALDI